MDQWTHMLPNTISENIKNWLLDPGSTTEKFARMNLQMSIDVLRSELVHTPTDMMEGAALNLQRDVSIHIDSTLFMCASSITKGDRAILEKIANLQNDSLGSILFKKASATRSEFQFISGFIPKQHAKIDINPTDYLSRKSEISSKEIHCTLIEAFNLKHPLLMEDQNG